MGHVDDKSRRSLTKIERVGSNGGLARYRLIIEPWLALLRYRQGSYAFHDASVLDIAEQVFGHYRKGVVAPTWRWESNVNHFDRSATIKMTG